MERERSRPWLSHNQSTTSAERLHWEWSTFIAVVERRTQQYILPGLIPKQGNSTWQGGFWMALEVGMGLQNSASRARTAMPLTCLTIGGRTFGRKTTLPRQESSENSNARSARRGSLALSTSRELEKSWQKRHSRRLWKKLKRILRLDARTAQVLHLFSSRCMA
jgi:hypothetical protein